MVSVSDSSLSFKLEPWLLLKNGPDGLTIDDRTAASGLKEIKADRMKVGLTIAPDNLEKTLTHVTNTALRHGFEALGFYAAAIDAPDHPKLNNAALHYFLVLRDLETGEFHFTPYGNSVGNEAIRGDADPQEREALLRDSFNHIFSHNWIYDEQEHTLTEDANGKPVERIAIYIPERGHEKSYGTDDQPRIPPTLDVLGDWEVENIDKTDRLYDTRHLQSPLNHDLIYVLTPKDPTKDIGNPEDEKEFRRFLKVSNAIAVSIRDFELNPTHAPEDKIDTAPSVRASRDDRDKAIRAALEVIASYAAATRLTA
jgi:hypothetical protein